jgi:glucose-6-phosphate dehydrogenase assembly protein OpcA
MDRVRWVRVDGAEPTAGLLLVGWLASRLGWRLDEVRLPSPTVRVATYATGRAGLEVRIVAPSGAGSGSGVAPLTRAHLEVDTDDGPASVRLEAPDGHLVATVEVPGQPTARRKVGQPLAGTAAALAGELQVFGRDRIFEDALTTAAALAAAR